jgi:transcriptional regulator with XRE-family HTH domain
MMVGAQGPFGAQLKALREVAGFTQEELATIAGLSVHAVSALERGGCAHDWLQPGNRDW